MYQIIPEPISELAFAPFGDLLEAGRWVATSAGRPGTRTIIERKSVPVAGGPRHRVETLERHPTDSQAFVPLDHCDYLVVVCPNDPEGGPDLLRARAFRVPGTTAIQYRPGTWHAGMTALAGPAEMVIIMDRDFGSGDCEFQDIKGPPIEVLLGGDVPTT